MKTGQIVYTVFGVGVVGACAFFAWEKWGDVFTGGAQSDTVPMTGASSTANAPPDFTPTAQTYAPIAVGVNTSGNNAAPPGVPSSQITLPSVETGNATVTPQHEGPSVADVTNPAHAVLATTTGHASIPTGDISSAPANIGNAELIDQAYMSVFGHHADSAGLQFWKTNLDNGTINTADLHKDLIQGARGSDIGAAVIHQPQLYVSAFRP